MLTLTLQTSRLPQPTQPLSDKIVPSIPGEVYVYPTQFSENTPLQVFMKCKANKNRSISELPALGKEANLYWDIASRQVLSIQEALRQGLIVSDVCFEALCETWITGTTISPEDFYSIANQCDAEVIKRECELAFGEMNQTESLRVSEQLVVASKTSNGKYGLFLITEISDNIRLDACHVLVA